MFVQCDLDLVLTEYHKERLESQLKSKERYLNKPVLIELTQSTRLQIPTNCILYTKSSFLRPSYLPLSPPSLPLSLFSNLTISFITSLTSLFFFQSSSLLLSLHYLGIKYYTLEITNITDKTKITEQGILTCDSILPALIIQILCIMAMLYLGTSDTLFFASPNVTNTFT